METPRESQTPGGDPWVYVPSDSAPSPPGPSDEGIPWEHRQRIGNVSAFWKTVTGVMMSPTRFYRAMPPAGDFGPAILFALMTGLVGAATGALWNLLAGTLGFLRSDFAEGFRNYAYVWVLVAFAPFLILLELFFWSLITHVLLAVADAGRSGFKGTVRVISYAQAPALLSIIPVCGGLVGGVWTLVVQIIGLREAHRTTTLRAAFATLFPLFLCAGLLATLLTLGVFAGLLGTLADYR